MTDGLIQGCWFNLIRSWFVPERTDWREWGVGAVYVVHYSL
jgi:hypothetical protein